MNIVYADQPVDVPHPSIFLAGPTPRAPEVLSWRPEAIALLDSLGYCGTVLVPERRGGWHRGDYLDQVEWEFAGLEGCSVIVFWVPRDVTTLPGFTTNVEFGRYVGSGRCVYGRPERAPHTRYLDWLFMKLTKKQPENSLLGTLEAAVVRVSRRLS
jgi:hypothetical protein